MIPSLQEIVAALYGAWRLVFMDRGAMRHFDLSVEGFWRSFVAAVLVIPYYLLVLPWPHLPSGMLVAPSLGWIASAVVAYVIDWIAFPLIVALLCGRLGLNGAYIPFIIAYNWSGAVGAAPQFLVELLYQSGTIGGGPYELLQLAVFVGLLWYTWVVARIAFGASAMTAIGLVLLANLLDIVISLIFLST